MHRMTDRRLEGTGTGEWDCGTLMDDDSWLCIPPGMHNGDLCPLRCAAAARGASGGQRAAGRIDLAQHR